MWSVLRNFLGERDEAHFPAVLTKSLAPELPLCPKISAGSCIVGACHIIAVATVTFSTALYSSTALYVLIVYLYESLRKGSSESNSQKQMNQFLRHEICFPSPCVLRMIE
jgi:hypothetical protein